jgi:hypothetical protein
MDNKLMTFPPFLLPPSPLSPTQAAQEWHRMDQAAHEARVKEAAAAAQARPPREVNSRTDTKGQQGQGQGQGQGFMGATGGMPFGPRPPAPRVIVHR